ncbi:MAG TPA: plastocyanin/azurin family copper-binding protein [Pyrinomonadaceae bacterium]
MSYRLLRTLALASAVILSSLLSVACDGRNEGGPAANVNRAANGGASSEAAQARTKPQRIEMGDDLFLPAQLTVAAGTKVTWVNKGSKAHTVVSNDKLFDSGLVNVGGEFSHTFDAPGTYLYHCAPHAKMIGQIVVK